MDRDGQVNATTPRGFRDIWGVEASERGVLCAAMLDVARSWGYERAETPVLENARTLVAGAGAALEGDAFRLFDLDGGLLALRPEMTVPIARLVTSRLAEEPSPQRLAYAADVFREHASYRGQYRQFTQVGVEIVGASGAIADAECVAIAIEMLAATGLPDFSVAIGDVGVLRGLLAATALNSPWQDAVLAALHERNLVELDSLVASADLKPELAEALTRVPRLRGGFEAVDAARELAARAGCDDVLDGLVRVREILTPGVYGERIAVDFGIVRAFDYYTGIVLEASAPGIGLPLGGGGRYDGLLAKFGRPMPAAGFALGLERVHIALAEQGVAPKTRVLDVTLGGQDAAKVFETAAGLRASGKLVAIVPGDADAVRAKAQAAGSTEALWVDGGDAVDLASEGGPS